jgi:hypothetical protein
MDSNHKNKNISSSCLIFKRKLIEIFKINLKYIIILSALITCVVIHELFIESSYINLKALFGFDNKQWSEAWVKIYKLRLLLI